jgi:LytS/YehU family sensor histidine kinase
VQVYINLQKTRFKKGLEVNLDISEDDYSRRIPPVTLQNMVENAIKHNIIDIESPLVIDIFTEEDYLVVKNNLQKKNVVETSNRLGLSSLQSLYRYLSEKPLQIEETQNEFIIRLPLV